MCCSCFQEPGKTGGCLVSPPPPPPPRCAPPLHVERRSVCVCVCERGGRVTLIPDLADCLCMGRGGGCQRTSAAACSGGRTSSIFIVNRAVPVRALITVCTFAHGARNCYLWAMSHRSWQEALDRVWCQSGHRTGGGCSSEPSTLQAHHGNRGSGS